MLRISCPWCGGRDEVEFRFGGEAHVARPDLGVDDIGWSNYLFFRSNPKGLHYERWCHSFGCGQWLNVIRDTVTHEIHATYLMGEAKPTIEIESADDGQLQS